MMDDDAIEGGMLAAVLVAMGALVVVLGGLIWVVTRLF
jgi:hypothetical protein